MKGYEMFPRDSDTIEIIKEMEIYLGVSHKDINGISDIELIEYIGQLAMALY